MTRCLLRADGTQVEFERPVSMVRIHELLNAKTLDAVALHRFGTPLHVLLVDDNGWESEPVEHDGYTELRPIRPRKPINEMATRLYHANCVPGTTHQIAGDAFVCPDDDHE